MISITRHYTFEAAHKLPSLTTDVKCHRLHGHSYKLRVRITRAIDSGTILEFGLLDEIVFEHVLRWLDHQNLNEALDDEPTLEAITTWIATRLVGPLAQEGVRLLCIEVDEGQRASARVTN